MAVVVSIINLKGGVGKSTIAMILAEYLAFHFHKKVLLIDMDAQANLSYLMVPERGIKSQTDSHKTIYDFFQSAISGQQKNFNDFVARPPLIVSNINNPWVMALNRPTETLDMVISTPSVAQLDIELMELWKANKPMPQNLDYSLKRSLDSVHDQYDAILIDCPPGLSFFSSAALVASDFFVSPIVPEPLSLEGVRLVQDRARVLSTQPDCKVEFAGAILNIVKHYRPTHKLWADRIYGQRSSILKPFTYWLPDNDRLRALGEFEIDEERIKDGWAAGADRKFYIEYSKYSVGYLLNNPEQGPLSRTVQVEGEKYRLHERIGRLVEEFGNRVGVL